MLKSLVRDKEAGRCRLGSSPDARLKLPAPAPQSVDNAKAAAEVGENISSATSVLASRSGLLNGGSSVGYCADVDDDCGGGTMMLYSLLPKSISEKGQVE
jgi:hypothetical protein